MELTATTRPTRLMPYFGPLFSLAFDCLFGAYVFVTIFLPSGTLYSLNFKSPLYVGLLPLAAFALFNRHLATYGKLCLTVGVPLALYAWVPVGTFSGFALKSAVSQYKDIFLTLLLCWLVYIYCSQSAIRRLLFLKMILYSEVTTCLLKVSLILYALTRGISVFSIVQLLDKAFGVQLMTMNIGVLFGRIQFVSDGIIPVATYILLRHRKQLSVGPVNALFMMVFLVASVIFSFSRYFWISAAIAFTLGLILSERDRFKIGLIATLALVTLISLPGLVTIYQLRFSANVAGASDDARAEQIPALQEMFYSAPFLGRGLGSYTPKVVRGTSDSGSYAYEVQLLALSAQVGVVGMGLFTLLLAYYYSEIWMPGAMRLGDRFGILVMLGIWIAAGLSNPLLFLPVAGINYAALWALAGIAAEEHRNQVAPRLPNSLPSALPTMLERAQ